MRYQASIEEIGHTLLDQFQTISQNAYIQSPEFSYDPITAAEYIVQYTSNPDYYSYCSWEPHVVVDESFWNPAYQYLWDNEMMYCNDCADYVSQALSAGGLPIDDIWKPFMVPAWIRPRELMEYLVNANRGFVHENLWALQLGDLGFSEESGTWQHVVMISYVNPFLFSAHTSDRQNFTFSSVAFNKYMSIFRQNPEIVFLPIVKSESVIFVSNPKTIIPIPYPQPPGFSEAAPGPYP